MKNWIIPFSLLLLYSGLLHAQINTIQLTRQTATGDSIKYQVLELDTSVYHGPYYKYNQDGMLIEKGYYHNGKRTGRWFFYETEDGDYRKNELKRVVDYGKPVGFYDFWKVKNYEVLVSEEFQKTGVSYPPRFTSAWSGNLGFKMLRSAKRMGIGAKVLLTVTIDKEGYMSFEYQDMILLEYSGGKMVRVAELDLSLYGDIIASFRRETLRVFRLCQKEVRWVPAIKNGEFVTVKFPYIYQINTFRL